MVYREGNLVSGRLEALIQHMVPTLDYYPDRAFLFAFLLTSRLFVKPHDLLGQICAESKPGNDEEGPSEPLIRLIGEWSETFPYDFRDERVMSHVRDVAESCVSMDDSPRSEVSQVLQSLLEKLTSLERYEAYIHSVKAQATASMGSLSSTDVSELCGSAVSLAQQLTHIELERLSYIGPEEFVQAFAKESPNPEPRITHNYEIYCDWFPRLAALVLTDICRQRLSKKHRIRVIEFWIDTAKECFKIGNFNSLMAIIAGVNKSPISRLKKTWSHVDRTELSNLEREVSFYDDYCSYRSSLRAAAARFNKGDPEHTIVIPLFSLLASDLHTLCQECLTILPNGHINFEKFWQLAKQVTEFITWKQVHCPFPKSPKVITYLQATPVLNEDGRNTTLQLLRVMREISDEESSIDDSDDKAFQVEDIIIDNRTSDTELSLDEDDKEISNINNDFRLFIGKDQENIWIYNPLAVTVKKTKCKNIVKKLPGLTSLTRNTPTDSG